MKSYAVVSGKGGVGKTTFSANLGIGLARFGYRVLLFDADLSLANLDIVLGARPEFSLQHVLNDEKTIGEIMVQAPGGVSAISGGSAVGNLMASGPKRIAKFLDQLSRLESMFDILIFDTGAGLDNKVMSFARAAHEILLVTTPEPTAITDAYATAKVTWKKSPEACLRLVVNCVTDAYEGICVHKKLATISQSFLSRDLVYAGCIREDAAVTQAIRHRKPLMLDCPSSMAALDIEEIAQRLMREGKPYLATSFSEALGGELAEYHEAS